MPDPLTHPPVGSPGRDLPSYQAPPPLPVTPHHVTRPDQEERKRIARFVIEVDYFGSRDQEDKMALELASGLRFLAGSESRAFDPSVPEEHRPSPKFRVAIVNDDEEAGTVDIVRLVGDGDAKSIDRYRSDAKKLDRLLWSILRLFGHKEF